MNCDSLKHSSKVLIKTLLNPDLDNIDLSFIEFIEGNNRKDFRFEDNKLSIIDPSEVDLSYFRLIIDRAINYINHSYNKLNISNFDNNNQHILTQIENIRLDLISATKFIGSKKNLFTYLQSENIDKNFLKSENIEVIDFIKLSLIKYIFNLDDNDCKVKLNFNLDQNAYNNINQDLEILKNNLYNTKLFYQTICKTLQTLQHNLLKKQKIIPNLDEISKNFAQEQDNNCDNDNAENNNHDNQQKIKNNNQSEDSLEPKPETDKHISSSQKLEKTDISNHKKSKNITTEKKCKTQNIDDNLENKIINKREFEVRSYKYKAYTKQFDEIVNINQICSVEEIKENRQLLDDNLERLKNFSKRSLRLLENKLLASKFRKEEFLLENGILNHALFPRLIIDPNFTYMYKNVKQDLYKDTIITLLLDNSGSMRGKPIMINTICAELLGMTLEKVGIKLEVLGFTTKSWQGGQSRKLWEKNNTPINPGRLNDMRFIIYKQASQSWRSSKKYLGGMLKDSILKENIDGEALLWTVKRLGSRPEKRKILIVISDGTPVDDSTLSENSPTYLDNHLLHVINFIEKKTNIELIAIGLGHDVTMHYTNAFMINNVQNLGNSLFQCMSKLL